MSKEVKDVWITTVDNPFDPFTQWERWFQFDEANGYKTCERVAAFAHPSKENLTNKENNEFIDQALTRLCDFYGDKVYRIVVEGETQSW